MPLPDFNDNGDLPPGVYQASWEEIVQRFGQGTGRRASNTRNLRHIYELATKTGCMRRFVVFGSYVTGAPEPNDVDVILIMEDGFEPDQAPIEARGLFDHAVAQARYNASIFWMQPALLLGDTEEAFVAHWQIKRDGSKRGIIEVTK